MSTVRVLVTAEQCRRAREWERTVFGRLPRTPNHTGLTESDRFFTGFVGELALANALWARGVTYCHRVYLTGRTGKYGEITTWIGETEQRVVLDVKTGSKALYQKMMMPMSQSIERGVIYVAARFAERMNDPSGEGGEAMAVDLMGWENYSGILDKTTTDTGNVKTATRSMLLENMRDIEELFGKLLPNFVLVDK